jgi:hypothetical protein
MKTFRIKRFPSSWYYQEDKLIVYKTMNELFFQKNVIKKKSFDHETLKFLIYFHNILYVYVLQLNMTLRLNFSFKILFMNLK